MSGTSPKSKTDIDALNPNGPTILDYIDQKHTRYGKKRTNYFLSCHHNFYKNLTRRGALPIK